MDSLFDEKTLELLKQRKQEMGSGDCLEIRGRISSDAIQKAIDEQKRSAN